MRDATAAAPATERATRPAETTARTVWGEPLRRLVLVALALLVAAAALTVPAAVHVKYMSAFDEPTHADYAWQMAHGHIPGRGSILAAPIRAAVACRTPAGDPSNLRPLCGQTNPDPKLFGAQGQNYNFGHPPLYYFVTGVLARASAAVFSSDNFILFARLVGALWMFAAMLVLYVGLRRLAVRWQFAFCGALLLPCIPSLMYSNATITNDATAALSGSLAVLLAARFFVQRKVGWLLPTLVTAGVTATKVVNVLPELGLAVVMLLVAWLRSRKARGTGRELVLPAIAMIGAAFVVYEGWSIYQKHRGVAHWVNPIADISSQPVHGFPFDDLFSTSFSAPEVLSSTYLPPQLANNWASVFLRIIGVIAIAAVGAVLARHERWSPRFTVAIVGALVSLTYPWVVELQTYVTTSPHRYFPSIIPRYGMSAAGVVIAAIALAADDRNMRKTLFGLTGASVAVMGYTLYGAF